MRKYFIFIVCLVLLAGCTSNGDDSHTVNYVQAKEQIINNGALLIDVRTKEEYDDGHIDGAILLTLDDINETSVSNVVNDKNKPIVVYCKSGVRSHQALEKLESLGYKNVYDLGAMSNWKE